MNAKSRIVRFLMNNANGNDFLRRFPDIVVLNKIVKRINKMELN